MISSVILKAMLLSSNGITNKTIYLRLGNVFIIMSNYAHTRYICGIWAIFKLTVPA